MKHFKSGLMALVICLGIFGAFAFNHKTAPSKDVLSYTWTRVDGGTPNDSFNGTVADAKTHYGCTGTTTECADGVNGTQTAKIFQPN